MKNGTNPSHTRKIGSKGVSGGGRKIPLFPSCDIIAKTLLPVRRPGRLYRLRHQHKGSDGLELPGSNARAAIARDILEKFLSRSVNGIAIVAGTNNLVDRNGEVGVVKEIADRMETLVRNYQRAGFRVAIVKVPGGLVSKTK